MALVSVLCAQWLTQHNSHPHPLRFSKVIDKFTCTFFVTMVYMVPSKDLVSGTVYLLSYDLHIFRRLYSETK